MSFVAGVLCHSDALKEGAAVLSAVSACDGRYGFEDSNLTYYKKVGMAWRALHTRSESKLVPQPVLTDDRMLLTWDGRLDNREDLQRQLKMSESGSLKDTDLVLAAYRRWGQSFLPALVGDFALALWVDREQCLYLARDPFAGRPLHFVVTRELILWASTMRAIFRGGVVRPEVNDAWVEGFLVDAEPSGVSPFATVEVVAPGEVIVFAATRGHHRLRYWAPDATRSIVYRRDEDYEEEFRALLREAIRCRLRVSGPVFAELSGGVDSSSIVCIANDLIKGGHVEATQLHAISWVFDRASQSDERRFIRVIEKHIGQRTHEILEDQYPMLTGFERVLAEVPNGHQIWPAGRSRVLEVIAQKNARVLLSGFAGDQLLWSQVSAPYHLGDLLLKLRFVRLVVELRGWHHGGDYPYPFLLMNGVLRPVWRTILRGESNSQEEQFSLSWLSKRVRDRAAGYMEKNLGGRDYPLPSQRIRHEALQTAINARSWLFDEVEYGLETYYPFLDRGLVAFCLAVPFEQLVRPTETRSIHRRALKGILPERIRTRQCKRGPTDALMRGFRREWGRIREIFERDDALIYQRGYVSRAPFLAEIEKICRGLYGEHAILHRALQVEGWLRNVEEGSWRRGCHP